MFLARQAGQSISSLYQMPFLDFITYCTLLSQQLKKEHEEQKRQEDEMRKKTKPRKMGSKW